MEVARAAQMSIRIEKQKFHFKVVVVNSDGLLGLEFLENNRGCINLKNIILTLGGRVLSTHRKDKNACFRVAGKGKISMPARHGMIVSASSQGGTSERTWLVKPLPEVLNETPVVTKSLVNDEWDN